MKKQLFIILPLILALISITCKDERDPAGGSQEPPLTLDQRLVGGRWYYSPRFEGPDDNNRDYYEFTADSKFIQGYDKSEVPFEEIPVYSKNGIVYSREYNNEILRYEFNKVFTRDDGLTSSQCYYANLIAKAGDLITCISKVYSLYPDNTLDTWKFLIRFKEDRTPYQVYD